MWMPLSNSGWLNPNVGLVALIAAAIDEWGTDGEKMCREALVALGRHNASYMESSNHAARGASPTEWGRYTLRLMDMTGFTDYQEVEAAPARYAFRVSTYPYTEPFRWLGAPPQVCDIPADWDRGCLLTLNPAIAMTHPRCLWRGDVECLWVYEMSEDDS